MAGAPVSELVARIIASDEASETLAKVSEQVEATAKRFVSSNKRAQEQIAAIIAKGDPAKQAKIAADKEIEQAQRIAKARPQLAEQAAAAEVAIRKRLADTLAKIDTEGAAKASAGQVSLRTSAKASAETLSKVAGAATQVTSAFGGMLGPVGSAASSIVGAFGAGGPVAIAIAATAATIGIVYSRWRDLQAEIDAKKAEIAALRGDRTAGAESSLTAARSASAGATDRPGDEARRNSEAMASAAKLSSAALANAEAALVRDRSAFDAERERLMLMGSPTVGQLPALEARVKEASAEVAALRRMNETERSAADEWATTASILRSKAKAKRDAKPPEINRQGREMKSGGSETSAAAWGAGNVQSAVMDGPTDEDFARERARQDAESADAAFRTKMKTVSEDSAKLAADGWMFEFSAASGFIDGMAERGDAAMTGFMGAMDAARKRDAPGVIGGILQAFGAVASLFGPAGAAVGLLATSAGSLLQKFEDGGPAFAVGRRGLATMPGGNDGIPSVLHPGEFTFSAPAVRAMGGIGAATQAHEALRDGRSGGSGGSTTINVVALDPQGAVGVIERSVEPAMSTRLAARQGALYRAELQRAARGPRSGV